MIWQGNVNDGESVILLLPMLQIKPNVWAANNTSHDSFIASEMNYAAKVILKFSVAVMQVGTR